MKRVYLLRHGKTERGDGDTPDFERPLLEKGREDSSTIGVEMKKVSLFPERILCSSAVRALETAELCAKALNFEDVIIPLDSLYSASTEHYMEILRTLPDELGSAMIVGHNPTIEEFHEGLIGKYSKLGTSHLTWYDIEETAWREIDFESTLARSGMLLPQ